MQGEVQESLAISSQSAIAFFAREELPSNWRCAAALVPFEAVRLQGDVSTCCAALGSFRFWIARHRDCSGLVEELCRSAEKSGARQILLGAPRWEEQARALAAGAWVLPEPEDPLAFLRWLCAYPEGFSRDSVNAPTLTVNAALRSAFVAGSKVPLQPRESALLLLLREAGRQGMKPDTLCQRLFGEALPRHRRLLSQHIHQLRSKLGSLGEYITFDREAGYCCMLRVRLLDVSL
jgi:DNA-binding response OmpR family regulator